MSLNIQEKKRLTVLFICGVTSVDFVPILCVYLSYLGVLLILPYCKQNFEIFDSVWNHLVCIFVPTFNS